MISDEARHAESDFAQRIIVWQGERGRHDLPWQNTRDPYRIWLSEIMLQQTQVAAVLRYYERFLVSFPTVAVLAAAPVEAVMAHWSGLGYYTRARNLHACARQIMERHGGCFPDTSQALGELPGIGRSTAAAIAVFAYGERVAILDGNVKRVLCRVYGIEGVPTQRVVESRLWSLAGQLVPDDQVERYTQGLMDLGATVCLPKSPTCDGCPVARQCVARMQDRVMDLPSRRARRAIPERKMVMLFLHDRGRVLLEKRPPRGVWGGLWSLPEFPSGVDMVHLRAFAMRQGRVVHESNLPCLIHGFTHFVLHADVVAIDLDRTDIPLQPEHAGHVWLNLTDAGDAALPAPIKALLNRLAAAHSAVNASR